MTSASSSSRLPILSSDSWQEAAGFDEVAKALMAGRYIDALRLAKEAAQHMKDAIGPEHPDYSKLQELLDRR